MSFRFCLTETFEAEFRRITKEQIAKAHKHLAFGEDSGVAVHEARKCVKRLRALMRLYRPVLGKSDFSRENARYRDIGRLLSRSRDHQVTFETVVQLINGLLENKKRGKAKRLHRGLAAVRALVALDEDGEGKGPINRRIQGHAATRHIDELRLSETSKRRAILMLDDAQSEIGLLLLKGRGFKAVGRGLEMSYSDGVRMFLDARRHDDDDVLHEWRKSVVTHWRQMWLLREAWPEFFVMRVTALKEISRTLGLHSDLCLVDEFVRAQPSSQLDPKLARSVCKYVGKLKSKLRADALDKGLLLFADDGMELRIQVGRYWSAARKQDFKGGKMKKGSLKTSLQQTRERKSDQFKLSSK